MNREEAQQALNQRFEQISKKTDSIHSNMIAQARDAYAKKWGAQMSPAKEAILKQSLNEFQHICTKRGMTRQQIASAVSDVANVDNPVSMLYNLMSILIPNFAYTEVVGMQPIPTKKAPIFFPQITAAENRNTIQSTDKLLGATNWSKKNTYSTNKNISSATISGTSVTFTASEGSMIPETVVVRYSDSGALGTGVLIDDGEGNLVASTSNFGTKALPDGITAGTVNYTTGAVAITLGASSSTAVFEVEYRYDWGNDGTVNGQKRKPAQILFEWATKDITANPYRLRSTYDLDNFYAAKQVLGGYDIDGVLGTALGGLINKEVSCNVFDDMLARTDATFAWNSTTPTGVDPSMYKLSVVQKFVEASNAIRNNIARCGGNYIIAGTDFMNILEALPANYFNNGNVWTPEKFAKEPIGPYVAGNLLGKFKVLKNQDYEDNVAVMGYKTDDVDSAVMGGSYISLYSTNPIALDDLAVIQGCGTQVGFKKVIDNSLVKLVVA